MSWHSALTWDVEDLGNVAGVGVRRLAEYPGRSPARGEKADAVILDDLSRSGVAAVFAENDLWTVYWVLMYWDAVFARQEGSYDPRLSPSFPTRGHDIPLDLFQDGFFEAHRDVYSKRRKELETASLAAEVSAAMKRTDACWTRLLEDSGRFEPPELQRTLTALPRASVLRVLDRLWEDYRENRRGLPDLLLLDPAPVLIEVKGANDQLTAEQATWLRYLVADCGIACEVLVIGWSDRKVTNLTKLLEGSLLPRRALSPKTRARPENQRCVPAEAPVVTAKALRTLARGHGDTSKVPEGVFWADHIKTLRAEPKARLAYALKHRPFPSAYQEAAVAVRALLRAKRKAKSDWKIELEALYALAVESELLLGTPYIEGIGPGFNVAESIRRRTLNELEFPYQQIGHRELSLLNASDTKRLVELWGEPEHHSDPQLFFGELWQQALKEFQLKEERRTQKFEAEVADLLSSGRGGAAARAADPSRSRGEGAKGAGRRSAGCASVLVLALIAAVTAAVTT